VTLPIPSVIPGHRLAGTVRSVTRDEAIQTGIFALAQWHLRDHGDRCRCIEGEQFGAQAAVVDSRW
jgi:hypothetical protein